MISVFSEISDVSIWCKALELHGVVGYDADCGFCCRVIRGFGAALVRRGLAPVPLQAALLRCHLEADWPGGRPQEMVFVEASGRCLAGVEAILAISRHLWWACWLPAAARVPGVRRVLNAGYRWVSENRHCLAPTQRVPGTAR